MQDKTIQAIFSRRMLVTLFFGFSSGLPLLAIGGTLQAWLKSENVDIETIGLFALTGLPYTLKFLWAPIFDRFTPSSFGRRRSWILITQSFLFLSLFYFGFLNPKLSLNTMALVAVIVAFFSASQDVVLDAHRRDTLEDEELGFGSSLFVNGYRIGMLISGAFALTLSDIVSWNTVYMIISSFMAIGIITTFFAPEPEIKNKPVSLKEAVIDPLKDLFSSRGFYLILVFILIYKIGDSLAAAMTTPYILEMGYSRTALGTIAKGVGLTATIAGGLLGGLLLFKLSYKHALIIFGVFQSISTLGFLLLNHFETSNLILSLVIAVENLASGVGTAAFVAYMATLTNKKFSATQYALLTSVVSVPRTLFSASTGYMVSYLGWDMFFIVCTLIAIPGLLLISKITK